MWTYILIGAGGFIVGGLIIGYIVAICALRYMGKAMNAVIKGYMGDRGP
jgi:hypothetical protein